MKSCKGGIKITLLFFIFLILAIGAVVFSYDMDGITDEVKDKAQDAVESGSDAIVDRVVDEGREAVGEKLKEVSEKMLAEDGDVGVYADASQMDITTHTYNVIFFTASWCPSCVEAEKVFEEQIDDIPAAIAIWRADFDTSQNLRQEYDVDKAHTFVLIDADGEKVSQWQSSASIDDIMLHITQ